MPKGVYDRTSRLRPLAARFSERYVVNSATGCWEWTGGHSGFGHGTLARGGLGSAGKTKVPAHRVSYELYCGSVPDGLCVLHKCDVPRCVNPDHLFLGTKADNSADMVSKGRSTRGVAHPGAKLTVDAVRAIRQSALTLRELASAYNVSQEAVRMVRLGLSWTHV
jgi:hypothetical protein